MSVRNTKRPWQTIADGPDRAWHSQVGARKSAGSTNPPFLSVSLYTAAVSRTLIVGSEYYSGQNQGRAVAT